MMVGILAALASVFVAAGSGRQSAQPPTSHELFDRGRTAFGRAEYRRAIEILRPLLYPEVQLDSEGEVVQAHRMLGVAYLFQGQPDEARREFHKLLELRPDYRFDPLLDPQQVVDAFNALVKDEEAEIASIEARRVRRDQELAARRQREARLHPAATTVISYERHAYLINFFPFGAGQFQNGQRRKGWWFLGSESVLAATSVATFAANFALYGANPHRKCLVMQPIDSNGLPEPCPPSEIDRSASDTSAALERVQLATGGLFFAVAIWGIVDAIRHFQRDVPMSETSPASPADAVRVGIAPFGLGATFQF